MDEQSEPVILHLYCRVDVVVTDPAAVIGHAVADLRSAGIDWSTEENDLDTAVDELRADPTTSLASVADISRLVDDVPGVEFRAGHCWAESGPAREAFPAR
ncbi:hypothetical protein IW249_001854 [Micromonospora vinacea]|uniref:Halobacterial output domain-containing protein n=1 Tax=Micromonospora vinacea TaxID=709878 RepID=A0ABS0JYU4_9ACTN|nr:hypothetical protein [Micromonospora vinacea]MBG6101440.1 hypothetical protein [Micromonospora vinacea]